MPLDLPDLEIAVEIEGTPYFSALDVARALDISRQTLWRWRKDGVIPPGHRYRDRRVLFTVEEIETIREYAQRLEPIEGADLGQLRLFNGVQAKGGSA